MNAPVTTKAQWDAKISNYIAAVTVMKFFSFKPVLSTLDQVPELAQKLLALRGLLRREHSSPHGVSGGWAFTQHQNDDFKQSDQGKLLNREIRAVKKRFDAANKSEKYTLGSTSKFRPLETQIGYWNGRENVQERAVGVLVKLRKRMAKKSKEIVGTHRLPAYPDLASFKDRTQLFLQLTSPVVGITASIGSPDSEEAAKLALHQQRLKAIEDFAVFLRKTTLNGELKTATPGISHHGRGEAVDFLVRKAGVKVVGASNAAKWRSTELAGALADAMKDSKHFEGPLKKPDEPWHWDFHA